MPKTKILVKIIIYERTKEGYLLSREEYDKLFKVDEYKKDEIRSMTISYIIAKFPKQVNDHSKFTFWVNVYDKDKIGNGFMWEYWLDGWSPWYGCL